MLHEAPQDSGHSTEPDRSQELFENALRDMMWLLRMLCAGPGIGLDDPCGSLPSLDILSTTAFSAVHSLCVSTAAEPRGDFFLVFCLFLLGCSQTCSNCVSFIPRGKQGFPCHSCGAGCCIWSAKVTPFTQAGRG